MKWTIEGADRTTGASTVISVDAPDERGAAVEAGKRGLLVSAVRRVDVPPQAEDAPDPLPAYKGLQWGGMALRIFGLLSFVAGLVNLPAEATYNSGTTSLIQAMVAALLGCVLIAAGDGCDALRDVARNSFQK